MEPPSLTPSVLLCGDDPSSQGEPRALSKQGLHSKTRTWLLRGLCLRALLPESPLSLSSVVPWGLLLVIPPTLSCRKVHQVVQ